MGPHKGDFYCVDLIKGVFSNYQKESIRTKYPLTPMFLAPQIRCGGAFIKAITIWSQILRGHT